MSKAIHVLLREEDEDTPEISLKNFEKLIETVASQAYFARESKNLSINEAADLLGISKYSIYRLENRNRTDISIPDLLNLANKYEVSIDYLLSESCATTPEKLHEDYDYEISRKHIRFTVEKYAEEHKELFKHTALKDIHHLVKFILHFDRNTYNKKQKGTRKFTLGDVFVISKKFGINISDVIYPSTVPQNEIPVDF